jgi:hypothetical protein
MRVLGYQSDNVLNNLVNLIIKLSSAKEIIRIQKLLKLWELKIYQMQC